MPVDQSGPGVVYDHVNPLWLAGSDADEDIGPIHSDPCNKVKTKADAKRIAKTKRQAKKLRLILLPKVLVLSLKGALQPLVNPGVLAILAQI
jgi:hypothetical protein